MAGRLWIFDLDDTLLPVAPHYGRAIADFIRLMLDVFGYKAPYWFTIAKLVNEIDNERADRYGGARFRFPSSLVVCYLRLCKQVEAPYDKKIASRVCQIGMQVFDINLYLQDTLIPGVEETLNFLIAQGDELRVLTKGDLIAQWRKYHGYHLERWFPYKKFLVVRWEPRIGYPGDKRKVLTEIRKRDPGRKIYFVGDSIRFDMIPASQVGITPIYIPTCGKWDRGLPEPPLPPEAIVLKEIAEIMRRHDEL